MALSKSSRIIILLAIDSAFFLLELVVGYAVHSLALVADAFHMLNDVLSLCVGLWAVKVAQQKTSNKMYTYGWQRAETLGALVNGVFLVALCLSIFLEAIQRFVEPQEVSNPKLVLIVGCFGLASNIMGLFLFHDHGHSHGGHEHSHGKNHVGDAERGQASAADLQAADETGNVADVLPESRLAVWPKTQTHRGPPSEDTDTTAVEGDHAPSRRTSKSKAGRSRSRTYSNVEDLPAHPASLRRSIIASSKQTEEHHADDAHNHSASSSPHKHARSSTSLLKSNNGHDYGSVPQSDDHDHSTHKHAEPDKKASGGGGGGHGHSHGDLNMRGVFLHVMGDALGNIGVIVSALLIWLTKFEGRFYFDPAVSLVITVIILLSAIPLCKAASRILLQAVPAGISVDDIRDDIQELPGVVSCHHLHVWQLSDTKLVASLHIQVAFDFEGQGSARYMKLALAIRECLHEYGIHSSTIQPEFCLDPKHDHAAPPHSSSHFDGSGSTGSSLSPTAKANKTATGSNTPTDADSCLLECADSCGDGASCCPPADAKPSTADDHEGHRH